MSKSDGERWPASSATTWNPTADIQQQIEANAGSQHRRHLSHQHKPTVEHPWFHVFDMLAAGSVCDLESAGNKPWYLEGWTYTFAAYGGSLAMTWRLLAILPHYCVFLAVCSARIALRCAMVSSPTFKKWFATSQLHQRANETLPAVSSYRNADKQGKKHFFKPNNFKQKKVAAAQGLQAPRALPVRNPRQFIAKQKPNLFHSNTFPPRCQNCSWHHPRPHLPECSCMRVFPKSMGNVAASAVAADAATKAMRTLCGQSWRSPALAFAISSAASARTWWLSSRSLLQLWKIEKMRCQNLQSCVETRRSQYFNFASASTTKKKSNVQDTIFRCKVPVSGAFFCNCMQLWRDRWCWYWSTLGNDTASAAVEKISILNVVTAAGKIRQVRKTKEDVDHPTHFGIS